MCRETEQQLTYGVIVLFLELQPSPNNAFLKSDRPIFHKIRRDLFDLLFLLARVFESTFEVAWFGEVRVDCSHRRDKQIVKFESAPLLLTSVNASSCQVQVLTSIQCWMANGKFFTVHVGVSFSGGSCDDAYDSVKCGITTWVFPFVPRVPDSNKGFSKNTHRWSI